jgi:hypothetical protein
MFLRNFFKATKTGGENGVATLSAKTLAEINQPHSIFPDEEDENEEDEGKEDEDDDEEEGGIDIFQNKKNRFEEQYGELALEVEEAIHIKEQIALGLRPEKTMKKATTGRIQFDNILIEEKIPPLLLCDNCEKRYSVVYCSQCKEVFCLRCCELCHPIAQGEKLHNHEVETVHRPPSIRAITENDVSSVVINEEFPVQDYYIEENDLAIRKNIDLSIPNTLATNYSDPKAYVKPNTISFSTQPKHAVDDKLLFIDPITRKQAYGRVISEWDQRHGVVAPAIIRGEGSMFMYVVEKIDLIENIGTLGDLVKILEAERVKPTFPKFKDTEDVPYRWEFAAALAVNQKIRQLHEIQQKGPKRHYKDKNEVSLIKDDDDDDDDDDGDGSLDGSIYGSPNGRSKRGGGVSVVTFADGDAQSTLTPLITDNDYKQQQENQKKILIEAGLAQDSADNIPSTTDSKAFTAGYTMVLTKDEQLDRLREELPGAIVPTSPRDASKRSFYHAVQKDNPAAKESMSDSPIKLSTKQSANYMGKSRKKKNNAEPLKIIDENRAANVFIFMESELQRPEEVFSMDQINAASSQLSRRDAYLTRCFTILSRKYKRMAFRLWHSQLDALLIRLRYGMAKIIQTCVRRWLQRYTLPNLVDEWQMICYHKWKVLHEEFNYCQSDTPFSVTMNHKIYFRTKLDANRYSTFLRLICMKIIKFITRKRLNIITFFFKLWIENSTGLSESDLKYGHLDMHTCDIDEGHPIDSGDIGDYGMGQTGLNTRLKFPNKALKPSEFGMNPPEPKDSSASAEQQAKAQELYTDLRKFGTKRGQVSDKDEFYVNVTTMPLGLGRRKVIPPPELSEEEKTAKQAKKNLKGYYDEEEEEEQFDYDGELPPYHPSIGINLPQAIPVFMPSNAEERLKANSTRRLTYCSYKAHMEGPCDDACWVIPGRIAMGAIPWGRASKRTQTSSITTLLLGGCDIFISTMEEDEENECEKRLNIVNVGKMLKKAAAGARMAVDEVVRGSKRTCEDMERKLKNIPVLESTHPDYTLCKKEMTRCKARVKLANEAKKRAQNEFERLPKVFEWIRIPIKTDQCPTIHEIYPILWKLERLLSEGRSFYIYSREGHGRCGLLAGLLLGRCYGFNGTETLIRIQNSHDCAKREEKRPVPVNCPQLNSHKHLIHKVLNETHRPLQGVVYRHHDDPETKHDLLYVPKKGTGLGYNATDMPKNVQVTQSIPFSNTSRSEMDTANMIRQKESVSWEIKLERDVKNTYITEHGRGNDRPNIPEIYEMHTNPKKLGQNINVVRETDLQRQPENDSNGNSEKRAPYMPSLRVRKDAL